MAGAALSAVADGLARADLVGAGDARAQREGRPELGRAEAVGRVQPQQSDPGPDMVEVGLWPMLPST